MENTIKRKFFSLKSVAAAILSSLLILIFLSRTIYNYNLPIVTAVSPQKGKLNKIELTTGIATYEDVSELYSKVSGTVETIFVREGDIISEGQPIMEMSFEGADDDINKQIEAVTKDTEKKLSDLKINRDKLIVDIEKTNTNIRNTKRKIDELKRENYKQDSVSDYELIQCESDIRKAEDALYTAKVLFDAGAISRQELTNAELSLENLRNKYENLNLAMIEAVEKSADAITEKETNRERQLKDYEYQLEAYEQDLKSKTLDLDANSNQESAYKREMEAKVEDYKEALAEFEQSAVILATEDSFVIAVEVNKGQHINAHQKLMSFGLGKGLSINCEVSLNNNFVIVGDICALDNSAHSLEGIVTRVMPEERSKKVTISIQSDEVTAGETFDITFEKESAESYILIPNGAVNMDSDGYFLNQIKRRDGILGKEFYTEKLRVYIGDSDSVNTIIVKGVGFFEPVALVSDKAFSEGETVKLKNESDFFED